MFLENRINAQELKIDRDCENIIALHSPGVFNCKIVCLIIIEIPSVTPYKKRATTDGAMSFLKAEYKVLSSY